MTKPQYTTHSIYRITCTANGLMYIGQCLNAKKRKIQHFGYLELGKHENIHMQRAYKKYGKDTFIFEVIENGISEDDIDAREIFWIAHFNSFKKGFNRAPGGSGANGNGKECIWNGIIYKSLSEAARALNIDTSLMAIRYNRGYVCDSDVQMLRHECEWNGIKYNSIIEAAAANNVSRTAMSGRIQKGYTCDDDVKETKLPCIWEGVQYPSIAAAARATNTNPITMQQRVARGHTSNENVKPRSYGCEWGGVWYRTVSEAALANNVSLSTMYQRVKCGHKSVNDLRPNKRISR